MRQIPLMALSVLLIGATATLAEPGAPGERHRPTRGFPSCVAGTYLGEVSLDVGLVFQSLSTFGADGAYVTESTVDFGAGGTVPMAFRSAGRGRWQMTGPRKLRMSYLHFAFDGAGVLVWVERIDAVVALGPGCSSGTGEARYGIFPPGMDPLGDEPPVAAGSATLTVRRMSLD